MGRAKSQHICLGSRKVASYLFWFAQSRANFSFAQSRNIPILSGNARKIHFLGRASRNISGLGCLKLRNFFGHTKSQHTHLELQWSQHTFCGSRKVATHLFWVAQNRIISVLVRAKSRKFFGRAKSQHTHFESPWPQHTFFGSRKVASYLFWVAQSRAKFRSRKVATLYFESQCSHYNFAGSCEGASYLVWVAQNASYLFWVAQSRAIFSVAQSRNLPIMIRNGQPHNG